MPTDDSIDSIYARLRHDVAAAVSQILLQQSLRPQQLRSLNESLIAQIKASELFVLRHFHHLSLSPSLSEAPRTEDCDDEPAYAPFAPLIAIAPGCPIYGPPNVRPNPPIPPFSEGEGQEQAVVSNQQNTESEQTRNSIFLSRQHSREPVSSFNSPISQSSDTDATPSYEDAPSNDNGQGGTGPRSHDHTREELQGQERIQENNTCSRLSDNPPETLCDQEDRQSMASQTTSAQSCYNGRMCRQDKVPPRPPYGIQTRSKIRPKSNRIAPRTATLLPDNTSRDDESGASAATGKCILASGPEILGNLWDKAGRAGRVEVMREVVYDMIKTLRVGVMRERQDFNSETQETIKTYQQSTLLQVPQGVSSFQALREELEMSSAGEQLYRLRRRVALAQFYNDYTNAQADPHEFLYPGQNKEVLVKSLTANRKRKRASTSHVIKRRGNKLSTLVHNRVVDLMFPSLVLSDEDIESEDARMKREETVWKRKTASQKVKNWRASGKPWSALVKHFDWGILLLLPTDLLDQNMRMMKKSTLSCFFDALDFFFTDSGLLLPNSTALVKSLLTGQLPSKKLRIEHELPRYGNTAIDSLRYFGELLTPYEGISHSSEESGNSTPLRHADNTQTQLPLSDLCHSPSRDTSLEHGVLDSPHHETRLPSGIKTTVIATESIPSDIEGQSAISAYIGGIASADKLVSPHYFEDAILVTPFCAPDGNFDHGVE